MNHLTESHLTELQLDDHLIGDFSAEVKAHLEACELCSSRLASAFAPIAGFDAVTLAWGERRSATMPMQRFASRELTWNQRLAWTASMAAAIAVGFAIPMATNQARMDRDQTVVSTTTVASVAQPDEQIATDNQMLQAIDDQFAVSEDAPAALGLVSAAKTQAATPSSLQD
jgi:hypothetical protein